jgi:hypothetical protein
MKVAQASRLLFSASRRKSREDKNVHDSYDISKKSLTFSAIRRDAELDRPEACATHF